MEASAAATEELTGKLDNLSRAYIEKLAGSSLVDPSDLWRYGTEPADMLDENGLPDAERVTAAADSITSERPHLAVTRSPKPDPSQGSHYTPRAGSADPFADFLGKALNR